MARNVVRFAWTRHARSLAPIAAITFAAACGGDSNDTAGSGGSGTSSSTSTSAGAGAGSSGSGGGSAAAACSITHAGVAVGAVIGSDPSIAFGGGHFAVAWTDLSKDGGDITLTILDAEGKKLGEQSIASGAGESILSSVAHEPGGGWLVLWQEANGAGSRVRGRHASEAGVPTGAAFQLANSAIAKARPDVVASALGTAVAWADAGRAFVGDFKSDAVPQSAMINGGGDPSLASTDTASAAVWTTGAKLGFSKVKSPIDAMDPVFFRNAAGTANVPRITASPDGSFVVAWEDMRDGDGNEHVFASRIAADGKVQGEVLVPHEDGSANYPDVAWTGSRAAIVYYQFVDGPPEVRLSLFDAELARAADDLKLSADAPARHPRIAVDDGAVAVVYDEPNAPVKMTLLTCP